MEIWGEFDDSAVGRGTVSGFGESFSESDESKSDEELDSD